MAKTLTGSCLCGECTVTISPAEDHMHVCHCDMCRAWTGSALMAVKVMPGDMDIEGPVQDPRDIGLGRAGLVRCLRIVAVLSGDGGRTLQGRRPCGDRAV